MQYSDVLERLKALGKRLEAHGQVFFFGLRWVNPLRLSVSQTSKVNSGYPLHPALRSVWSTLDSVNLEWFVKGQGCKAAGIDSHSAPSGQFRLLTPEESANEHAFLDALAGGASEGRRIPFSKVAPGGELLLLDHESGAVNLVFLDAELTTAELAESLETWFSERIRTYFEENSLRNPDRIEPGVEVTLEQMNADEFCWPPRKLGW